MIDGFDLYNDLCSWVNTFQGGNIRLNEDFVRQVNAIYFSIVERETRNARKSAEAADNVIAFLVSKNISISKSAFSRYAIIPLPKDYYRLSSVRIVVQKKKCEKENKEAGCTIPNINVNKGKCTDGHKNVVITIPPITVNDEISEISVEEIDDNQWAGCLQHLTKYPTLAKPKMVRVNGTFQVAPKNVSVVVFSYYTIPQPIIINVTYTPGDNQFGEGDEVIYNASLSTPILLPITMKEEFLWRLGTVFGYFTRDQFLAALGNQKEKEQ